MHSRQTPIPSGSGHAARPHMPAEPDWLDRTSNMHASIQKHKKLVHDSFQPLASGADTSCFSYNCTGAVHAMLLCSPPTQRGGVPGQGSSAWQAPLQLAKPQSHMHIYIYSTKSNTAQAVHPQGPSGSAMQHVLMGDGKRAVASLV